MKGLVAISLREMNDHKKLLAGAALASLFPLVLPYLPGFGSSTATEVREVAGVVIALALTWIFAAMLGSSMIGNDLGQGRFGFFFTRPVSGHAIWWGKVLGNFLLVLGCEIIILAPALLLSLSQGVDFDFGSRGDALWITVGVFLGLPLFIITFTHALNVMVKARSSWLALDTVALLTWIGVCWFAVAPLLWLSYLAVHAAVAANLIVLLLALLIAGAVQVVIGRTDVQRSHRALSASLWAVLLPAALLTFGFSHWFRNVGPEDFTRTRVGQTAPAGSWIVVSGPAHLRLDYHPEFLYNTLNGSHLQVTTGYTGVAFSSGGKRAAWFEGVGNSERQLVFADLGSGIPQVQTTPLIFPSRTPLALSPDATRVAVIEHPRISVYELESGQFVTSVRFDRERSIRRPHFIDDHTVRAYDFSDDYNPGPSTVEIFELDIVGGVLEKTGEKPTVSFGTRIVEDPSTGRTLAIRRWEDSPHWFLQDVSTGEKIQDYGVTDFNQGHSILADGTFVRGHIEGNTGWLTIYSPSGQALERIAVDNGGRIFPRGEAAPGIITVSVGDKQFDAWDLKSNWTSYAVNLQSMSVTPIPKVGRAAVYWTNNVTATNPMVHRLFHDAEGSLLLWDPDTGDVETLLEVRQ